MVNYSSRLDATFSALADPTRRALLARLALGETSVSELARPFSMSLPGVLKHVEVLERSGLVTAAKTGRIRLCQLVPSALEPAARWIGHYEKFWEERLDALDEYLKKTAKREEDEWPRRQSRQKRLSGSAARSRRRGTRSFAHGRKPRP